MVARAVLAFLPVCLFLLSLVYLDSFKLVRFRTIAQLLALGCAAAIVSLIINHLLERNGVSHRFVIRFGAPAIEEILKGLPLLLLLRAKRIGFLIDAAIAGFAIGTGFALIENLYYLTVLSAHGQPALWIVRGFGTAVMHGGTTAILAITTSVVSERKHSDALWLVIPGLLMAFALHSVFNHFIFSPVVSTAIIVVVLPPLLVMVFSQSEQYLREWLGSGFDLDADLLRALREGEFGESPAGKYLHSLRDHFDGPVVADMLCYLRLHSELSLRAKGVLMLRENSFKVKKDADVAAKLAELRYLQHNIGKTGELALAPILRERSRDLWQLRMLESGE
jgi:RsiW-degrading membrane proteinase PrsW (M82 family)